MATTVSHRFGAETESEAEARVDAFVKIVLDIADALDFKRRARLPLSDYAAAAYSWLEARHRARGDRLAELEIRRRAGRAS